MNRNDIEQRITALGRPESVFAPLPALRASVAAKKEWDAANPEKAKEYFELVEALAQLERAETLAERDRRNNEKLTDRLARSGVGERSATAAAAARVTEAVMKVTAWLTWKERRTWLVLLGKPGCGKTVAATVAIRETLREGRTAVFRSTIEVAKLSMFDAGADELSYLQGVHMLVLDDYGTELPNDFAKAQLHQLLDARHEAGHRTIITSNLPDADFRERLGPRLADRVRSDGLIIAVPGGSLRGQPKGGAK